MHMEMVAQLGTVKHSGMDASRAGACKQPAGCRLSVQPWDPLCHMAMVKNSSPIDVGAVFKSVYCVTRANNACHTVETRRSNASTRKAAKYRTCGDALRADKQVTTSSQSIHPPNRTLHRLTSWMPLYSHCHTISCYPPHMQSWLPHTASIAPHLLVVCQAPESHNVAAPQSSPGRGCGGVNSPPPPPRGTIHPSWLLLFLLLHHMLMVRVIPLTC
jgi:hypothetical protein